jgi:hypothetical protein
MPVERTIYVQLVKREYDCTECGVAHDYSEDIFMPHRGFAHGYGSWIYEEVEGK